jgi:arsenate reductase-like glutaredoxin family protein
MKLIFFVIAFCLVMIRVYFAWSGQDVRSGNKGNIVITSDGLDERIEWMGQVQLNESENGILSISPGGYFRYAKNGTRVSAESNLKGAIDLRFSKKDGLYAGDDSLLLQEAVQELVLHGYDSKNRMERIYAKGGIPALISELGRMKMDNLQHQYIDRIFTADSLSQTELMSLLKLVRSMGNDEEKIRLLSKFTTAQLDSCEVARDFFSAIDSVGQDYAKHRVIQQLIEQDSLSSFITDNLLETISLLNAGPDKQNALNALSDKINFSSEQWIKVMLIVQAFSDNEKSNELIRFAPKMPLADGEVRTAFQTTAKTIGSDFEYGRVMRILN